MLCLCYYDMKILGKYLENKYESETNIAKNIKSKVSILVIYD